MVDAEFQRMAGGPPPNPATGGETPPPGLQAEPEAVPQEPLPFGVQPADTIPPSLAAALPPGEAGVEGNMGSLPLEATEGLALPGA